MKRSCILLAAFPLLLGMAASKPVSSGAKPAPVLKPANVQTVATPSVRQRVATLRATAAEFRRVAASIPKDAPAGEAAQAKAYADWLGVEARKMDALADQGDSALLGTREHQMSFNLQYLQLQSQMQHENRSYTAISNIMKTKHDTVKNSISNVR